MLKLYSREDIIAMMNGTTPYNTDMCKRMQDKIDQEKANGTYVEPSAETEIAIEDTPIMKLLNKEEE